MRPIYLKMTAFGPYVKTTELDFERGLGGANFFLIHGATGSGKTTILDAICYALYGESSGGSRTGKMMRSEQATPNDRTAVEFTFALRGKIYRIVRSPQYMRTKLRGDGLTEEKATAEIYVNGQYIETKDVSEFVRELLGFNSDQFRQVVVLPQGAFQKFLMARSDARQAVLNMLFNAEFFKRVEDELKLRARDAKIFSDEQTKRRNDLIDDAKALSGTEDFDEMQLPALIKTSAAELDAAKLRLKSLEVQLRDAQNKSAEGKKISELFKNLAAKEQELTAAEKLLAKILGELSGAKTELERRTAEEPAREELNRQVIDLGKKKFALEKLQGKRRELQAAEAAARKSAEEVERLVKLKQACDKTMTQLKSAVERLQDAPAKEVVARKILEEAQAREKILAEIADLRGKVAIAERKSAAATKSHEAAEKMLSELRQAQADGSAARLAANLVDGEPCPVCGAIHHPAPATAETAIPTDAQIKAAEANLRKLTAEKSSAAEKLSQLRGELGTREKNLSEGAQVVTVAEAKADHDKISAAIAEFKRCNERIKNGEIKTDETAKQLTAAQAEEKKLSNAANALRGAFEEMEGNIDAKYSTNPKLLDEEIFAADRQLNELKAAFERAQGKFNRLNNQAAAQRSTVAAAQKNQVEVAAQVEGKTLPDIHALEKILEEAQTAERAAVEEQTKLAMRLKRLRDIAEKISALEGEVKAAEKNFIMWKTLSDAASGKTSKISFQRYYLATMFGEVIEEANHRLEKMSGGRYRFQSRAGAVDGRVRVAGLDLEIVDDYTGTARPVETLSGGESFLASLSLALGLAAVVQNNSGGIRLDTIFIDEGFGTLDSETLDFAMKTLIDLQSGGRLVGIISHVEELKNQMPVRLEVIKGKTGSYAKFVS